MLLTLLLDPHGFFPPGFWSLVLAVLLGLTLVSMGFLALLRFMWRSGKDWLKLLALALGGGVTVAVISLLQGALHH